MTDLALCKSPMELKTAVQNGVRASRRALQEFLAMPKDVAATEVLTAFNQIAGALNGWAQQANVFQQVHPDPAMRAMGTTMEQEVHGFQSELSLHRGVYERLASIRLDSEADFEDRRFLDHSLRDYRRSGVDRDEATRDRIRLLQEELLAIGQAFDRNIVEASTSIRVEGGHRELRGMPPDFLASHLEDEQGGVSISTDPQDYLPIMLYAESPAVREQLAFAYNNRAYPENIELLDQMLRKRRELAVLLGFADWADYVTEDKMIGSGAGVAEFLARVIDRAMDLGRAQYAELLAAKQRVQPDATRLEAFDVSYWTECVKRERFAFDSQEVRPYLAYPSVLQGVLATASELFGVRFERREEVATWHPDAHAYDVMEGEQRLGRFYLDIFPRPGKFKHACVMDLRDGIAAGGGHTEVLPEGVLVANFPQPTATDPAWMLHTQVTTFFHEFGHLMHHMLSGRHRYFGFGGFGVEWDFVEVPSQLFEEWAWDHQVLAKFACHHATGEPIPADLVDRLRAAEEYGKGLSVLRQMYLATLSLQFHTSDPETLDTTATLHALRPKITLVQEQAGTHFQASFGHLNWYSAMYYTYMWSLVISKDLWSQFAKDPMDREVGARYRQRVLEKGGALDASEQVRDFLGRDYRFQAWEAWLQA
ncbi:MAG TPA: M3 family metallopeptidase [Planctomycetota bacterium]|nr:M3 family metallopeptidase [Planctomycetota bacterium]